MPEHRDDLLPIGVGEYLEAIFRLGGDERPVPIPELAGHLEVAGASANEMVRRLAERDLATYEPYKGVSLTEEGRRQALTVVRRHRLWERFLTDVLDMPWDQVHKEACRLEHATSRARGAPLQALEVLARALMAGPSPAAMAPSWSRMWLPCPVGARPDCDGNARPEDDGALLRYLDDLGLRPGQEVKLVGAEPFSVRSPCVHGQTRLLDHELGERIGVTLQEDSHE